MLCWYCQYLILSLFQCLCTAVRHIKLFDSNLIRLKKHRHYLSRSKSKWQSDSSFWFCMSLTYVVGNLALLSDGVCCCSDAAEPEDVDAEPQQHRPPPSVCYPPAPSPLASVTHDKRLDGFKHHPTSIKVTVKLIHHSPDCTFQKQTHRGAETCICSGSTTALSLICAQPGSLTSSRRLTLRKTSCITRETLV